MDWPTFGVLVLAGTLGAWLGMLFTRRWKRRMKSSDQHENHK